MSDEPTTEPVPEPETTPSQPFVEEPGNPQMPDPHREPDAPTYPPETDPGSPPQPPSVPAAAAAWLDQYVPDLSGALQGGEGMQA